MADKNVVRQDVIEIGFETDLSGLTSAEDAMGQLVSSVNEGADDIKQLADEMRSTKGEADDLRDSVKGISESGKTDRYAQTFQKLSSEIQNGENALKGLKTKLTSLPATAINKVKTKFTNLTSDLNATKTALTGGEKGAKRFGNVLKNLGKIGVSKLASGFDSLKKKIIGTKDSTKDAESKSHKFYDALKKVASVSLDKLKSGVSGVASALGTGIAKAAKYGLGALVTGSGAALKGLKDCMDVLAVQTAAETQLATTAKNMGIPDDAIKSIKNYASELQGVTMYGDEAYIAAAAEAATYFTDADAIKSLMGTVADYAAGMSGGVELSSDQLVEYTTNLAKMTTGAYDAMTKKGFEVTDVQKKILEEGTDMEKVAVINDIISESWGGMAQSFAETPTGKLTQLKNIFSDVKESIGSIFSPTYVAILGVFTDALSALRDILSDGWQDSDLEDILGIVNGLVDKAVQAVNTFAPKLVTFVVTALTQVVSSLVSVLPGLANALLSGLLSLLGGIITVLENSGDLILPALVNVLLNAVLGLVQMLPRFFTLLGSLLVTLISSLTDQLPSALPKLIEGMVSALGALIDVMFSIDWFSLGWELLKAIFSGIWEGLKVVGPKIWTWIKSLFKGGGDSIEFPDVDIKPVATEVASSAQEMSGNVSKAFSSMTESATMSEQSIIGAFDGINTSLDVLAEPHDIAFDMTSVTDMTTSVMELSSGATDAASQTVTDLEKLNTSFSDTSTKLTNTAKNTVDELHSIFHTDALMSAGIYMMEGLISGILSKKDAAVAAAAAVASAINAEYAKIQQINSPSRVWEQFGMYQIEGGIRGMENMLPELTETTRTISEAAYPQLSDPGTAVAERGEVSGSVENNSYAPQFNLYLSGSDSDRDMERKVKRWIREAMEDMLASAQSRSPRVREV